MNLISWVPLSELVSSTGLERVQKLNHSESKPSSESFSIYQQLLQFDKHIFPLTKHHIRDSPVLSFRSRSSLRVNSHYIMTKRACGI
jgi:hypothetical protein